MSALDADRFQNNISIDSISLISENLSRPKRSNKIKDEQRKPRTSHYSKTNTLGVFSQIKSSGTNIKKE